MLLIIDCKYKILGRKVMGIPEGMRLTIGMEESDGFIPSELSSQNFLEEEGDLMIRVKEPPAGPVSCVGSYISLKSCAGSLYHQRVVQAVYFINLIKELCGQFISLKSCVGSLFH